MLGHNILGCSVREKIGHWRNYSLLLRIPSHVPDRSDICAACILLPALAPDFLRGQRGLEERSHQ